MALYKIKYCNSIPEIGKLLHWVIDDPTLTTYDKSSAIRTAGNRIEHLVGQNSDTNDADYEGHTVLSWLIICQGWNVEIEDLIKRIVLEWGVNIDGRDGRNYTPLMWGVIFDRPRAIRLLLSLGANPHLEQSEGKTAFYFAEECDNQRAISELSTFS